MENIANKNINKYPKSIDNKQCIGPCYHAQTKISHPITLDEKILDYNSCPIYPQIVTDKLTGNNNIIQFSKCYPPTTTISGYIDEISLIVPTFEFNSEYFIKVYYKINSLDDMLKWLDKNKNSPYKTKKRVFDNGMIVYGNDLKIVDHRLVYYVNEIMNFNISKIYRHVKDYFKIVNDYIELVDVDNNTKSDNNIKIDNNTKIDNIQYKIKLVRSYIKNNFFGSDNIQDFLSKFIRYYHAKLNERNISDVFVKYMIEYIIKRIKLTLE